MPRARPPASSSRPSTTARTIRPRGCHTLTQSYQRCNPNHRRRNYQEGREGKSVKEPKRCIKRRQDPDLHGRIHRCTGSEVQERNVLRPRVGRNDGRTRPSAPLDSRASLRKRLRTPTVDAVRRDTPECVADLSLHGRDGRLALLHLGLCSVLIVDVVAEEVGFDAVFSSNY